MTPAPSPRPLTAVNERYYRALAADGLGPDILPELLGAMDFERQRADRAEAERDRLRASLSSAHGALHALLKTPCPRKCVILRAMALPPAPAGGPSP